MLAVYLSVIDDTEDRLMFERICRTYRQPMYYLASSILHSDADAEDAVHDVFTNIASKYMYVVKRIDKEADMRNYLLKAVKNTSLNLRDRRQRESAEYSDSLLNDGSLTDEEFLDAVCMRCDREKVLAAIRSLDRVYSETLYFHFVLDLTAHETAALLNRKVSTVKKQLVRGKRLLLDKLEGEVMYNDET